jgi:hypothetical protein
MREFVSSLTAAVLFIHTVFGCCWHHAHGCEHETDAASTQGLPCCDHQHDGDRSHDHQPCSVHCTGGCNFVLPSKVRVAAPQWIALDAFAMSHVSPWNLALLPQVRAEWHRPLVAFPPPLRLHLLHQLLLN